MFWRMLKGALTRQWRGKLLVVITVALGTSLATGMLNVMLDVGDKVNRELKAYGANLLVTPRTVSLLSDFYELEDNNGASGQYLAEADLGKIKTIFWANNILGFAPYIQTKATLSQGGPAVTLVGTWFNRYLELPTGEVLETGIRQLKPWWEIEGSLVEDTDEKGALVGSLLARKLGVRPGDELDIVLAGAGGDRRERLMVRGLLNGGGPEDERIFVPLGFVQQALNLEGKVSQMEVIALTTPENELARKAAQDPESLTKKEWETWYCTAYVSSIAYQIEEAIPGARAKPILQVAESEGAILQKTQLLMLLITVLCLVSSALGISNLMTAGVMERSRELGLLKAIGATDGAILAFFLAETVIIGAAGGLAGYFLGLGFAQVIGQTVFGTAVAVKELVIPLVIVLALCVTLAGSLPALRMLLRFRPAEVLHGR